VTFSLLISN